MRCAAGHDFVAHRDVVIYLCSQSWPPAGSGLNPSSRDVKLDSYFGTKPKTLGHDQLSCIYVALFYLLASVK